MKTLLMRTVIRFKDPKTNLVSYKVFVAKGFTEVDCAVFLDSQSEEYQKETGLEFNGVVTLTIEDSSKEG